jgi:hypothetical protein
MNMVGAPFCTYFGTLEQGLGSRALIFELTGGTDAVTQRKVKPISS